MSVEADKLRFDQPGAIDVFSSHQQLLRNGIYASGLADYVITDDVIPNTWIRAVRGVIVPPGMKAAAGLALHLSAELCIPPLERKFVPRTRSQLELRLLHYRLQTQANVIDDAGEWRQDKVISFKLRVPAAEPDRDIIIATTEAKTELRSMGAEHVQGDTVLAHEEVRPLQSLEDLSQFLTSSLAALELDRW